MGCGCVALAVGIVAATIFLLYASTDPGPPVEEAALAAMLLGIIVTYRALGVLRYRSGGMRG